MGREEAAERVDFPLREARGIPPDWALRDEILHEIDLPGAAPTVETFFEVWSPRASEGHGSLDPWLRFAQSDVDERPEAKAPLRGIELSNGDRAYVSDPPAGVEQGGAVTWWADGAKYTISSNVLTVERLIEIADRTASTEGSGA